MMHTAVGCMHQSVASGTEHFGKRTEFLGAKRGAKCFSAWMRAEISFAGFFNPFWTWSEYAKY